MFQAIRTFLRGFFPFLAGLGVSFIAGWWLTREQRQKDRHTEGPAVIIQSTIEEKVEPPQQIVLPPEAFEEDMLSGDDLTRIEGIGEKTAGNLRAMEIRTFETLASADAETLKAELPRVSIEQIKTWIESAQEYVSNNG